MALMSSKQVVLIEEKFTSICNSEPSLHNDMTLELDLYSLCRISVEELDVLIIPEKFKVFHLLDQHFHLHVLLFICTT